MGKVTQDGLKAMGFEVRVRHLRMAPLTNGKLTLTSESEIRRTVKTLENVSPKGGATCVVLVLGEKQMDGSAVCSIRDNFNRRVGFQMAAGRALKAWKEEYGDIKS